MIGYILLIILTIVTWVLFGFGIKHDCDWQTIVGVLFGLIFTVLTMVSSINLGIKASDAVSFKDSRDYHQELVYAISDNMSPATIANIISTAEFDNNRIEKNKKRCDSEMWGFMYNKGIAEVKPIDIPKYKISIEIEEDKDTNNEDN